jgi:hypothetical protein
VRVKHDWSAEVGAAAMKATPPVTVASGIAAGAIDPQWFVIVPTAVYVTAQLAYLLWKWRREWKAKRDEQG